MCGGCGSDSRQGRGGEGFRLLGGPSVGPGDALQDSSDVLVVGGVRAAIGVVDGGDGGAVELGGNHRQGALLHQVVEIGGHRCRRVRHGQGGAGLGPPGEGLPGGVITCPGVLGGAAVEELFDTLEIGRPQAFRPMRQR